MRLVFAGTPAVAVPSLRALASGPHEIAAVVTRSDALQGRKRVLTPSPVAQAADELGLPVIKADRLDADVTARIAALEPQLGVIVAYGGLVREPLLSTPAHGWINLHFSLLPRWRGAAPVQRALIAGDAVTGASVFQLVAALDAGDVFAEERYAVPSGATSSEVLDALAELGSPLLARVVDDIAAGTAVATPQAGEATVAPKLVLADGALDLTRDAEDLLHQIAGVTPEPGAHTTLDGARFKVLRATPADAPPLPPGRVAASGRDVIVGTGTTPLRLESVQPAGKGAMDAGGLVPWSAHERPGAGRMIVQGARSVAYDVLRAVSGDEAYANLLLPHAIVRAKLDAKDAGLATELTYGALRRRGTYDAIIAAAADRTIDRIDPAVLDALRLGVHQLLSTRVASHAAVNESVELARRHGGGKGAAGFANAVLRRVSRDTPGQWMDRIAADARSDDERLGLTTSHPVWIVRALRRALTAEGRADELDALLAADNVAPRVAMVALPGLAEVPDDASPTPYAPTAFLTRGGDPEALIRSSGGRIRVQDEGSQLAALALSRAFPVREGERWLDLCAGPGGKTALLGAEALAHGAHLDANEIAPARAGLVRQAVASVPLDIEVSEEDGRERATRTPGEYDRILVDAPCTGIGALRRRPEARWRKTPSDVPDLTALQQDLVLAASRR